MASIQIPASGLFGLATTMIRQIDRDQRAAGRFSPTAQFQRGRCVHLMKVALAAKQHGDDRVTLTDRDLDDLGVLGG